MHVAQTRLSRGFTITELIVVIAIIGILAAITIISYNGILDRSRESALKADLNSASKILAIELGTNTSNQYPASLSAVTLPTSSGTSYQYTVDNLASPPTFCLTGFLEDTQFFITQASPEPQSGTCPGHSPVVLLPNDGVVTTLATVTDPRGVAVRSNGDVFVVSQSARQIFRLNGGTMVAYAGSGVNTTTNGNGLSAAFNTPGGLAVDSNDNLYTAECNGQRIRKIDPAGNVTTFAGSGTSGHLDGAAATARFWCPQGVAIGPNDNVYVADGNNNRIRLITQAGVVSTLAGQTAPGFSDGVGASASFDGPIGITVGQDGAAYVTDDNRAKIRKVELNGTVTTFAGGSVIGYLDAPISTDARFSTNRGAPAIDSAGNVYVADGTNNRIRKITQVGVVTTFAGSGVAGILDGIGTAARFNYPRNIFITPDGTMYVTDASGNRLRMIR